MSQDDRSNAQIVLQSKLFARLPAGLLINLICASGTVAAFWFFIAPSTLLIWFGLMLASLWFRIAGYRQFQRQHQTPDNLARSSRRFTIGVAMTGLTWGLAAVLFYSPNSIVAQTFLPFILTGMVGGSLVVLTGNLTAFTIFILCIAIPFAFRLSMVGDFTHLLMTAMLMVYVVGLIALGRSTTQAMTASINLIAVNDQLIRQLREKSSQLQATFDHVNQGVTVFDHMNRLITWNPRHRELHGYPIHLYRPGTHIREFLEQDLNRMDKLAGGSLDSKALAEPLAPVKFQQSSADGRTLAVERNDMPGGGFVSTSTDITEHKQVEARMLHLAQHDPLTDLPNRLLFQDRLQQAMARSARTGSPLAVIVIDLDKFKEINDRAGHRVGDLVLKALARRLRTGLRDTDTVARFGGDEFAIVLPDLTSVAAAVRIAEKMQSRIETPLKLDDDYIDLRASFGIAIYPANATDAESLLQYADLAMYEAKSAGGGLRLARVSSDLSPGDNALRTKASRAIC